MTQPTPRQSSITSGKGWIRILLVALAVAGLALLAGCGGSSSGKTSDKTSPSATPTSASPKSAAPTSPTASSKPSASKSPSIKPSKDLKKVTVKNKKPGTKPKVKIDSPWAINKTQTKVLHAGHGDRVPKKGSVTVNYTGVDGRTGKVFESTFKKKQKRATFSLDKTIPGFRKGLEHQRAGSRVLIAMASKDAYGSIPQQQRAQMKQQLQQKGIKFTDTLVFVADIHATSLEHAKGKKVSAKSGLPKFSASGDKPKFKMPKSDPPKKTTVQPLIKGKGAKVKSGETVTTKSVTALWKNGKIVDNSWQKAWAPEQQQPQQPGQQPQKRLPAMSKAMVGHRVGSRLLIVWPPGTAYKNGDAKQHIGSKDTVVMVVDILFTQPKQ